MAELQGQGKGGGGEHDRSVHVAGGDGNRVHDRTERAGSRRSREGPPTEPTAGRHHQGALGRVVGVAAATERGEGAGDALGSFVAHHRLGGGPPRRPHQPGVVADPPVGAPHPALGPYVPGTGHGRPPAGRGRGRGGGRAAATRAAVASEAASMASVRFAPAQEEGTFEQLDQHHGLCCLPPPAPPWRWDRRPGSRSSAEPRRRRQRGPAPPPPDRAPIAGRPARAAGTCPRLADRLLAELLLAPGVCPVHVHRWGPPVSLRIRELVQHPRQLGGLGQPGRLQAGPTLLEELARRTSVAALAGGHGQAQQHR